MLANKMAGLGVNDEEDMKGQELDGDDLLALMDDDEENVWVNQCWLSYIPISYKSINVP